MPRLSTHCFTRFVIAISLLLGAAAHGIADEMSDTEFYEKKVRPLLVKHCYECHSEKAGERQGGLLLDRPSGWLEGGDSNKAVVPGDPSSSLLITAVGYQDDSLQMPPEQPLSADEVAVLTHWVKLGAPGPLKELGETSFSRLGDQAYLFEQAGDHWSFQPIRDVEPPPAPESPWNRSAIDRFIYSALAEQNLTASQPADPRTLIKRLTYDLTGLPPTLEEIEKFNTAMETDSDTAVANLVDELLDRSDFGEHFGRMWLDVARYADTDSFYRPDTKTPHYFPFAFTYRDYVIESLNQDKPFDQFVREQLAADLMGFKKGSPELAAVGFLAVGPHANRNAQEALDDWIDVTTRGLLGMTVACARCHDHKYEPIPTADYYALRGVFASVQRIGPLDEKNLPIIRGYEADAAERSDYEQKRAAIEAKIEQAAGKKATNNNRSIAQKIRETELAELLLFHPGAPTRAMIVKDRPRPVKQSIFIRGDAASPGAQVARRFLQILDAEQQPFPDDSSGRMELAEHIVSPHNPLTARVFVNRVWGYVMGAHLVATPSDFGLQGSRPSHPELLDWLADDFIRQGWSIKQLVRRIVTSQTYLQSSRHRAQAAAVDPQNRFLWRANRKHLSIEALRDSMLAVSGELDRTPRGRAAPLWDGEYTRRRAIYGYINRFNLDPTLRAFDFPTPMQTQPTRGESIVAPQALFTMNAPFVVDQAQALTETSAFQQLKNDSQRIEYLFRKILLREPVQAERQRVERFLELQDRFTDSRRNPQRPLAGTWPLVAQSLLMTNEFQYID